VRESHRGGMELHPPSAECGDIVKACAIEIVGNEVTVVVQKTGWAVSTDWTEPASQAARKKHGPQSAPGKARSSRSRPTSYSGYIRLRFTQLYGSRQSMGNYLFGIIWANRDGARIRLFLAVASAS